MAGEVIVLAATGLGELGIIDEVLTMLTEGGGVQALIDSAGTIAEGAATSIKNSLNFVVDT